MSELGLKIKQLQEQLHHLMHSLDIDRKKKRLEQLEKESQKPDFWEDKERAAEISQELSDLGEEVERFEDSRKELKELKELEQLTEQDEKLGQEVDKKCREIEKKIKKEETRVFLSGKYDKNNAILEIFSGAGGVDAQDWATMLLRMYQRYCEKKRFETKIIHQSFGEGGGPEGRIGTKSATLEIKGKYAYGFLKGESGVHRLVRQSPFSADKLRHTSFVLVGVLPEISKKDQEEIKIKQDDLKIETFRASGPGGQYVNRRETAVRLTHLPTGIVVSCQAERLQGTNKEKALKILCSKLYKLEEEKRQKELEKVKGGAVSASWGNQIRSYILHPYKMVKDTRTGIEKTNTEDILDGELDEFIEAEIKMVNN